MRLFAFLLAALMAPAQTASTPLIWSKPDHFWFRTCSGHNLEPCDRQAAARVTNAPVASPDGRWEALVAGNNVAIRSRNAADAPPRALSTDGTADAPYESGSIQLSSDSTSFTAYRVNADAWRSDAVRGSVKALVTKRTFRTTSGVVRR
jgi:hypothetical protein